MENPFHGPPNSLCRGLVWEEQSDRIKIHSRGGQEVSSPGAGRRAVEDQTPITASETKLILYCHIVEVGYSLLASLPWAFEWEFYKIP